MTKTRTTLKRTLRGKLTLLLLPVVLGLGGVAHALTTQHSGRSVDATAAAAAKSSHRFAIGVSPSTRHVAPGATTSFAIRIHRGRGAGRPHGLVRLSLGGQRPRGVGATFNNGTGASYSPGAHSRSSRATLTILTSADTPEGDYQLQLRAGAGRGLRATTTLNLVIESPPPAGSSQIDRSFAIGGELTEPLEPGHAAALDLVVTNSDTSPLSVLSLGVRIAAVTAPRASAEFPCTTDDFSVEQFSGTYPLMVPASSTQSLSELGISEAELPRVAMLNRPVNQNGCRGAALRFDFGGAGTGGTP
jgi:hypothetical protein